ILLIEFQDFNLGGYKMKKKILLLTILALVFTTVFCGQIMPPPNAAVPPPPPGLPIDGGLGFLLIAGLLYGYKRIKD
ncbi:hypothetical protein N9V96_03480, partial [Polaribacter sp.]|nr:hypothetical protein [Polaribacter sp.]